MKIFAAVLVSAMVASAAPPINEMQRRGLGMSAAPPDAPPVLYPMRDIPVTDTRFTRVYAAVLASLEKNTRRLGQNIEIIQVIDATSLLCSFPNGRENFLLKVPKHDATDGARVWVEMRRTNDVYKYIDVRGAAPTVRVYEKAAEELPMGKNEFIEELQSGTTYLIEYGKVTSSCNACVGAGWVPQEGKKTGSGRTDCKACQGSEKKSIPQRILVKWCPPAPADRIQRKSLARVLRRNAAR